MKCQGKEMKSGWDTSVFICIKTTMINNWFHQILSGPFSAYKGLSLLVLYLEETEIDNLFYPLPKWQCVERRNYRNIKYYVLFCF